MKKRWLLVCYWVGVMMGVVTAVAHTRAQTEPTPYQDVTAAAGINSPLKKINRQSANCHSEVFRGILFTWNDRKIGIPRSKEFARNDTSLSPKLILNLHKQVACYPANVLQHVSPISLGITSPGKPAR